jgi:hypothetical protein
LKIIGGQLIQDVMQPGFVGRQQEKLAPEAFRQFHKVLIFRLCEVRENFQQHM